MRQRSIRDALALPQSADEERAADRHIRLEAARIRAGWADDEFVKRASLPPGAWLPPMISAGVLAGDGDGTPADDGPG